MQCATSADGDAHDANVITANNANVIRLVGAGAGYAAAGGHTSPLGYLQYNYDLFGNPTATEWIIPRAVTLLDNTPGGPDLAGQTGPLVTGAKATNGVGDIGGNPVPASMYGNNGFGGSALQQGSEIHAESGDAFIYGGPADDIIYGGAQDDTIILGYGDNWVSGGRGNQCIIAGGRCLISRNGYSEPLNGVNTAIPAANLTQLITTPGNAQEAVINVSGALNFDALLYPYNEDPATWMAPGISNGNPTYSTNCKENKICPVYSPIYGHNIIYGGWGNGVVHGGPGNSAISGAEAPTLGYADNFNMYGNETQAQYLSSGNGDTVVTDYVLNKAPIETDFFHPVNPGNADGYMPNSDPPNGNQGRGYNIGKSLYFNAEDPRRQVLLFPTVIDPTVTSDGLTAPGYNPLDCEWAAGATSTPGAPPACTDATGTGSATLGLPFFLTFNPTDPNLPLDTSWYPGTGDPQMPVTGDKALFGDLGNDYIVGGMGRVRVYGGWGFDLIDLRASTYEDGGLNDGPVPNLVPSGHGTFTLPTAANSVYGTPAWEALAYGGAGQDIYFAGSGGDRLIDWVGNHNSYYVPFSQFGMPAVSRTLMPFLPEFLYALSKSDGADQTLGLRSDAFCASAAGGLNDACSAYPKYSGTAARNGEPFGELGLVLQHDQAWHQQSGPPFNEMPENLGGTGIDVQKTANVRPFASSGTCDYVTASSACTVGLQPVAAKRRRRQPAQRHQHHGRRLGPVPGHRCRRRDRHLHVHRGHQHGHRHRRGRSGRRLRNHRQPVRLRRRDDHRHDRRDRRRRPEQDPDRLDGQEQRRASPADPVDVAIRQQRQRVGVQRDRDRPGRGDRQRRDHRQRDSGPRQRQRDGLRRLKRLSDRSGRRVEPGRRHDLDLGDADQRRRQ